MEPLPPVEDLQQDELSVAFQLTRVRARTEKLHVPCGVQLTVSRAKMGHSLYHPTSDFLNKGPPLSVMKPIYNSLHDPHLHSYNYRRAKQDQLKKGKHITEDNEVICSLRDYNTYEKYLKTIKLIADQTYDEAQRDKMKKFIELQEQSLLPGDVNLADVMEVLLEEAVANRRQLLQPEPVRHKDKQEEQEEENDSKHNETDLCTEVYTLTWNAEDRSRLTMYEREFRHELNKKKYLRELQKEKDRKKQALLAQKCAVQHGELLEILNIAKGAAKEHSDRSKLQADKVWLVPPGGDQYRLSSRKGGAESRILRSVQMTGTDHKPGTREHDNEAQERATAENSEDPGQLEDCGENGELIVESSAAEADHPGLPPRSRPFGCSIL